MEVFELRNKLIEAYREYASSFIRIRDARIKARVAEAFDTGRLWPHPQLGLNPAFESGGTVRDLVEDGLLLPECEQIFRIGKSDADKTGREMTLHRHQVDAIRAARDDRNYVLTTGTGSGKSLSYIIPIVDHVLRTGSGKGVKAIVVYPMNALANSQKEELDKFLGHGPWGHRPPVTYRRYTGQENDEERQEIRQNPPDIILTNYVMLELVLTRYLDRRLVGQLGDLRFLVLDELHTYRGRQGADVALLVRRLREASGSDDLRCVGTSATLSTEGSHADRQVKVADVASLLFGAEVRAGDVISETLQRVTTDDDITDPAFVSALAERLRSGAKPSPEFEAFVSDPLSIWIESTFGLRNVDDRVVRAIPAAIDGSGGGASQLEALTGVEQNCCREMIREQLMAGYDVVNPTTGFPVFAFRLHQFLSRGDTVYASPELASSRYLTLDRQRFVPGDRNRTLLPLAFCRACGQDYYVVRQEAHGTGTRLVPRDIGEMGATEDTTFGFLYMSDDQPWPDDADEVLRRIPDDWIDERGLIRSNRKNEIPRRIGIRPDGELASTDDDQATTAWWSPTPFRFCPACGVAYAGRVGRDFGRLTTLGSEGRSTATTVMSLAAIRELRADTELSDDAKKLLSFTDNRQDASLQAGHFNDFVQVTLLRAALWRAVDDAGEQGLTYDQVPQKVFESLNLPFDAYAREKELKGAARTDTDRVLREVLAYRLYRDLVRGWRLTQPNLEQTGLLVIEYESLTELAAAEEDWADCHDALRTATPKTREHVLGVLLDTIRRELAIRVEALDPDYQESMRKRDNQRLDGVWSIEDERLEVAKQVLIRSRQPRDDRNWVYVSARGGFGQFVRRVKSLGAIGKLTLDDTTEIIEQLFDRLKLYGLVEIVGADNDGHPRFQLPASAMRWKAADGTRPYHDHIRMPNLPDEGIETNRFFVDLYRTVGEDLLGVEAREHTAQVPYDLRLEREDRFRRAELPVLYCSPTMELGVDISQLNVVNMRNVPPTPANYAQRSGRAGRSGQPALVFTYCSAGSSHDQYFFRQPELMVAGQVEAPRLELANEDLLRAHVHAVWLAESGLDLGKSMTDVLDLDDALDDPKVFPSVQAHLDDAGSRARANQRAKSVLADLEPRLREAPWWSDTWLDETLAAVPAQFANALYRWRSLYRSALQQAREQSKIKQSANRPKSDRVQAERLRRQAENQLDLLRAESDNRNQSDFYTYRYFAAEGFLPGYSFPRLPLSAFIPGQRATGTNPEFVQRPRFLAISEFGPQSLIYHEGTRYRINQVILPVGDVDDSTGGVVTTQVKRCENCGYLHPIPSLPGPDVCRRCRAELPAAMRDLFRLQNVSTVRRDRITSDEEERQRKGYEIISGVHFAERTGRLSVDEAEVIVDGEPRLKLAYGDTATIWRINLGWRRRQVKEQYGFLLDVERGYWESAKDADADLDPEDPMSKRRQRVIPYVEDTRNTLLIEPSTPLDAEQMASLEAALKAAFQVVFQLEEDELATEPLPSLDDRKVLLFYESAEGGAGVLRRLVDEPDLWPRIAKEALRRCHVDPVTLGALDGACEAACYDCLLSYRNQIDHQLLDRQQVIPIFADLRMASLRATENVSAGSLVELVDSALEAEFVSFLRERGLRLPDRAQVYFEAAGAKPDFVYDDACAVVFIDGPHHDHADRQDHDREIDAAFRDLGYKPLRFGHRDDWAQLVDTYRSVFGEGSE